LSFQIFNSLVSSGGEGNSAPAAVGFGWLERERLTLVRIGKI